MTENNGRQGGEVYHEYQVVAGVAIGDDTFHELRSEWHSDRTRAVEAMATLRDQGHLAEVHSRTIHATVDGEEVPR